MGKMKGWDFHHTQKSDSSPSNRRQLVPSIIHLLPPSWRAMLRKRCCTEHDRTIHQLGRAGAFVILELVWGKMSKAKALSTYYLAIPARSPSTCTPSQNPCGCLEGVYDRV